MADPFIKIATGLVYWDPEGPAQEEAKKMVEEGLEQLSKFFGPMSWDELFSEED